MSIARAQHASPRQRSVLFSAAEEPKTNGRKPAANGRKPPANGQKPIADGQEPTAPREFPEAKTAILAAKNEIVAGLIAQAKRGSYLHAKFLFDFAGLNPAAEAEADACAREASLARILLDQLASEGMVVPGYSYEGHVPATAQPPDESV